MLTTGTSTSLRAAGQRSRVVSTRLDDYGVIAKVGTSPRIFRLMS